MISKSRTAKDFEESSHGLIGALFWYLNGGTDENHEEPQSAEHMS
jgi:hypothetical protein